MVVSLQRINYEMRKDFYIPPAISLLILTFNLLTGFAYILGRLDDTDNPEGNYYYNSNMTEERDSHFRKKPYTYYNIEHIYRVRDCEPWYYDALNETQQWQDFLEELEIRGLWLSDPEAEDVWEEFN